MRVIGIIPARWASTRLPGKPLALLAGKPLIEHVWHRAARAKCLDQLLVATDDKRIAEVVKAFGGQPVMTPTACASGTDRLACVVRKRSCDVVVNIQGDEPFLDPAGIDRLAACFRADKKLLMATLSAPLPLDDLNNPNVVKVVCDQNGYALYFSRATIPHIRDQKKSARLNPYCLHVGMYAYRRDFVLEFARWPRTPLEKLEQLEQLRALERGVKIKVVPVSRPTLSVDTPEDLEHARRLLTARRCVSQPQPLGVLADG